MREQPNEDRGIGSVSLADRALGYFKLSAAARPGFIKTAIREKHRKCARDCATTTRLGKRRRNVPDAEVESKHAVSPTTKITHEENAIEPETILHYHNNDQMMRLINPLAQIADPRVLHGLKTLVEIHHLYGRDCRSISRGRRTDDREEEDFRYLSTSSGKKASVRRRISSIAPYEEYRYRIIPIWS